METKATIYFGIRATYVAIISSWLETLVFLMLDGNQ